MFHTIAEEDMSFFEGDIREFSYPDFGKSDSSVEVWQEFYAFFTAYVTTRYEANLSHSREMPFES